MLFRSGQREVILALFDVGAHGEGETYAAGDYANGVTPAIIGGRHNSHHGKTLTSLIPAIVERRPRGGPWGSAAHPRRRENYLYRLTPYGVSVAVEIGLDALTQSIVDVCVPAALSLFKSMKPFQGGLATGGVVQPRDKPYIVGEQGPEILLPCPRE